jgi:anti-sigma factor RsiW
MRWRRRDYVCQEMVELVTDYLEGRLGRSQSQSFESHLAGCEHCTEYLAQMRRTIAMTGRLDVEDLTPVMRDELLGMYRRWRAVG